MIAFQTSVCQEEKSGSKRSLLKNEKTFQHLMVYLLGWDNILLLLFSIGKNQSIHPWDISICFLQSKTTKKGHTNLKPWEKFNQYKEKLSINGTENRDQPFNKRQKSKNRK